MAAFGVGPFDDTKAAEWVSSLLESDTVDSVAELLLEMLFKAEEHLDVAECSRAVAAAELVAALNGRFSNDLPNEIRSWARSRLGTAYRDLMPTASRAIAAVIKDSELQAFWEESEHYTEWRARMDDLAQRLT